VLKTLPLLTTDEVEGFELRAPDTKLSAMLTTADTAMTASDPTAEPIAMAVPPATPMFPSAPATVSITAKSMPKQSFTVFLAFNFKAGNNPPIDKLSSTFFLNGHIFVTSNYFEFCSLCTSDNKEFSTHLHMEVF
jgi:hypothetical protein